MFSGGNIVIDGLVNIPEVGLPIEENIRTGDDSIELVDHSYYTINKENKNDELVITENNADEREEPEVPKTPITDKSKQCSLKVRPPQNTMKNMPYSVRQTAANKAASDLVWVTEERNTIQENYYIEKLKTMQDSVEIKKKACMFKK